MSRITINATGKDLTCIMCKSNSFTHEEVTIEVYRYRTTYSGKHADGTGETQIEMFTCRECGWTTFFEMLYSNDESLKINDY